MQTYRVGLVGCGAIFLQHANAVAEIAEAEIAAVCDIRKERAEQQAAQFGGAVYTDYEDMIQNAGLDAVHICTPHDLHAPMAVYALEHGVHVMVEKPMALSYADAQAMVAAQSVRGAVLDVIFQNRYNDVVIAIRDALSSGTLGAILAARAMVAWSRPDSYYAGSDWKGTWKREGGACIINQSIHTLDLMRYLIDRPVAAVDATLARHCNTITETEDTAEGVVTFDGGVRGLFYVTNCNACNAPVELTLHCENGTVYMRGEQADIVYENGETVHICPEADGDVTGGRYYWGFSHKRQIGRFYDSLSGNAQRIPVEEALKTQQMIDMIYQSGKKNF